MTIFALLDEAAARARSRQLLEEIDALITEGSMVMREFRECLDDEAMQKLNGWWVRASNMRDRCKPQEAA